jgi:hypothetical protein
MIVRKPRERKGESTPHPTFTIFDGEGTQRLQRCPRHDYALAGLVLNDSIVSSFFVRLPCLALGG